MQKNDFVKKRGVPIYSGDRVGFCDPAIVTISCLEVQVTCKNTAVGRRMGLGRLRCFLRVVEQTLQVNKEHSFHNFLLFLKLMTLAKY